MGSSRLAVFGIGRANLALVCIAGFAFDSFAAAGATAISDNPYKIIFQRNLFGLRPPMTAAVTPPAAPLPTIVLTGITTILGDKRAFLEITPPAKPAQPPKQTSCILTEGQRQVEVIQIDPKSEFVKVSNDGTLMTLTFEKNGRKTTPASPPPPVRTLPHLQTLPFRGQPR
jgi:hypothetical protein